MKTIRILIADDHEVVREGARSMIERQPGWQVCGMAVTGREAVERAENLKPDVVVLDMNMPDMNGLEAARRIRQRLPQTEILIFTGSETDALIRNVFDAGAKSFILKSDAPSFLVDAIRSLSEHKPFFTSNVAEIIFARFLERTGGRADAEVELSLESRLSAREREIVQLLAEGNSNKQIADTLGISVRTAETHRASILRKLNIDSLADLVRYAIRNAIIEA